MTTWKERGSWGWKKAGRLAFVSLVCLGAGCQTYSERLAPFRGFYGNAQFPEADAEINRLIADETGQELETVVSSNGLGDAVDPREGDTDLLLLEKAMVQLALGNIADAVSLLNRSRESFDEKIVTSIGDDFWEGFKGTLSDDTSLVYPGADYEHLMIRCMLAMTDLLQGGEDAYSYALQINEKQEEILNSDVAYEQDIPPDPEAEELAEELAEEFAEEFAEEPVEEQEIYGQYSPRQQYSRIALGAYLEGIIQEANVEADSARNSFQRAQEYLGSSNLLATAIDRANLGVYAPAGHGAVHVFYLGGRAPILAEVEASGGTEIASRIAGVGLGLALGSWSAAMQAPVVVPQVQVMDEVVYPLEVSVDGGDPVETEIVLDVNAVALEQGEANLPVVIARAVVRRSVKAGIVGAGEFIAQEGLSHIPYIGMLAKPIAFIGGAIANLIWTGTENADTRNWSSLPAQVQVTRFTLEEGVHELLLGQLMSAKVEVKAGHDTFVLVVQPRLDAPGSVVVDVNSRVEEETVPVPTEPGEFDDVPFEIN